MPGLHSFIAPSLYILWTPGFFSSLAVLKVILDIYKWRYSSPHRADFKSQFDAVLMPSCWQRASASCSIGCSTCPGPRNAPNLRYFGQVPKLQIPFRENIMHKLEQFQSILHFIFYFLNLVNPATDGVIQDAGDEEAFNVAWLNVQLPGDEFDLDPGVRLDQLDQNLEKWMKYWSEEAMWQALTWVLMFLSKSSMCSLMKASSMIVSLFTFRNIILYWCFSFLVHILCSPNTFKIFSNSLMSLFWGW